MAFIPANAKSASSASFDNGPRPVPRAGLRKARVSLIVDMGTQPREDFVDESTGATRPQKPCHQVAVFVDLVADTVDYGGSIGKAHYRLPLNREFAGVFSGINFLATPPKDADGKIIQGKPWGLHPASPITKVAKAIKKPGIIESMDIEQLLGEPLMIQVEVKETQNKAGKLDKDGKVIVYKNVSFRGCAEVPEDDDGNMLEVAELKTPAKLVTFENATAADIKFLRAGLIRQIKQAHNYEGSAMERAIKEWEASVGVPSVTPQATAQATPPADKPKATPKPVPVEDSDDDAPF